MTTHSDMSLTELMNARIKFVSGFDNGVMRAQAHLALDDIDQDDEETLMEAYEERYHCEVCLVREIMDCVMPAVATYIETLEAFAGIPQETVN